MQTMVPLYGFGGGGGTGAALTVNAPAGCTVTVSKDGKTKTKVAGADGVAVFKGLATGEWTLTINDGSQTASKPVMITADYSAAITFFSATIHVTYPAGSVCKAILNPEYGTIINNAGTVLGTVNGRTYTKKNDGEAIYAFVYDGNSTGPCVVSTNADALFYLFDDAQVMGASGSVQYNGKTYYYTNGAWFRGNFLPSGKPCITTDSVEDAVLMLAKSYEDSLGVTFTAPDTSGTWDCVVPNAGKWTVSLDSGFAETVDVTTSGATYTVDKWHLYNLGNDCAAVTGGWKAYSASSGSSCTFGDDAVTIAIPVTNGNCVAGTVNKVGLTGWNTLNLKVDSVSTSGQFSFYVSNSQAASSYADIVTNTLAHTMLNTVGVFSLDIGSINTDAYIGFGGAESLIQTMVFSEVWLE